MRKFIESTNEYGMDVFTVPNHVVSFGEEEGNVVFYTTDGNKHIATGNISLNEFVQALNRELTNYYDRS